jgi:5-hydroxyisourate hydrolase
MSAITTHVLDTARGRPAAGVPIVLLRGIDSESDAGGGGASIWQEIGRGETDGDGRLRTLCPDGERPAVGTYRLVFDTGAYFAATGSAGFYPAVEVIFLIDDPAQHYHVPLLLSPYGYSTYRGS